MIVCVPEEGIINEESAETIISRIQERNGMLISNWSMEFTENRRVGLSDGIPDTIATEIYIGNWSDSKHHYMVCFYPKKKSKKLKKNKIDSRKTRNRIRRSSFKNVREFTN